MRTGNELEDLSAAEPPLLAQTESIVDTGEEERILERILASDRPRPAGRSRMTRRRRVAFLLVGAALAVAVVAMASIGNGSRPAAVSQGPHRFVLSGATIRLAGYRFRTPAGFSPSTTACASSPSSGEPTTVLNGFAAAASADGGCVEAAYLIAPSTSPQGGLIPADAQPVGVGTYQGYYVAQDSSGKSALYVGLPKAGGTQNIVYLVLLARGLTENQLVAVAVSGLPA